VEPRIPDAANVLAGIKSPAYLSTRDTIVEHTKSGPESAGDHVETEPAASVMVQVDSGLDRAVPLDEQMVHHGWTQETFPQNINEADATMYVEMTFGEHSQFDSTMWWTDADSTG
jgi:hypothetical protein